MENLDGLSKCPSVTGEILTVGGNSLASEQCACEAGSFLSCVHCQEEGSRSVAGVNEFIMGGMSQLHLWLGLGLMWEKNDGQ